MRSLSFVLLLLGCYGGGIARAQTTENDVQIDLQPCILAKSEIVSMQRSDVRYTSKYSNRRIESYSSAHPLNVQMWIRQQNAIIVKTNVLHRFLICDIHVLVDLPWTTSFQVVEVVEARFGLVRTSCDSRYHRVRPGGPWVGEMKQYCALIACWARLKLRL